MDADQGRSPDERGAALVEFAIVVTLLVTLLFGIISFGVMLAAKQTLTQSASEGARAALTPNYDQDTDRPAARAAALAQAQNATAWLKKTCDQGDADGDGLGCDVPMPTHCDKSADVGGSGHGAPDCVTVTVTYFYAAHPIVPSVALIGSVLPDTLHSTAVVTLGGK